MSAKDAAEAIEAKFVEYRDTESDIRGHIQRLAELGGLCAHITEFGVGRSTWAFLHARPKVLRCYDILSRDGADATGRGTDLAREERLAEEVGIDFRFTPGDTLTLTIEPTDLLFIDTHHVYEQLRAELERHGDKASKYIVMHDTTICAAGLWPAIEEFLAARPRTWRLLERWEHDNGLTVLRRVA